MLLANELVLDNSARILDNDGGVEVVVDVRLPGLHLLDEDLLGRALVRLPAFVIGEFLPLARGGGLGSRYFDDFGLTRGGTRRRDAGGRRSSGRRSVSFCA